MENRHTFVAVLAASLLLPGARVAVPQGAPAPAAPTPAAVIKQPQNFSPGLDDLMTLLIQPRNVKLYYAGRRRNWALAAAQVSDLRSAFKRIAQTIPRYQGSDVQEALNATVTPKLKAMDLAAAAANLQQFTVAYSELTAACNACHFYMEHDYLVIKVPDSVAEADFADQEFGVTNAAR